LTTADGRHIILDGLPVESTRGENAVESPRYPYWPITRRPPIAWPNGARVAFWVGLNVEYFEPDKRATSHSQVTAHLKPDALNYGWREYGPRVGIWRIMETLDKYGMRASVLLNADVCAENPEIIEEGNKRKWAWLAHGKNNSNLWTEMSLEEERHAMADVVDTITRGTGQHPRGWLGPGLSETYNTPDVLAELGLTYNCNRCNDDQPYPVQVKEGRLISLPYSNEINDIGLFVGKTVSGPTFLQIVSDHFDVLYEEGARRPCVMALALHPFVIGQPFRAKYLDKVLEYVAGHDDVWLTTSDDIADWYYEHYYDEAIGRAPAVPPR
jgi:allantoinase